MSTFQRARSPSGVDGSVRTPSSAPAVGPGKQTLTQALSGPVIQRKPQDPPAQGGTAEQNPADPNANILSQGMDAMIPSSVVATSKAAADVESYLLTTINAYFDAAEAASPDRHEALERDRVQRLAHVTSYTTIHAGEVAAMSKVPIATAASKYNNLTRGEALARVVGSYEQVPVTLPPPSGMTITFRTPYNINDGDEKGGADSGRNTPETMATHAKAMMTSLGASGFIDLVFGEKGHFGLAATTRKEVGDAMSDPAAAQPLGLAVTAWLRRHSIGVDCAGLAYVTTQEADTMLGGAGWASSITRTGTSSATMTTDGAKNPLSREVHLDELIPGDLLRFDPDRHDTVVLDGHHVAIITMVTPSQDGQSVVLGIAHSNELKYFDQNSGIFKGGVAIPLSYKGRNDLIESVLLGSASQKHADDEPIPELMGALDQPLKDKKGQPDLTAKPVLVTSKFAGFRRFYDDSSTATGTARGDKKLGSSSFA